MGIAEQFANRLDGCTKISKDISDEAKELGLVIVSAYSDDMMELDGAIYEEIPVSGGGFAYFRDGEVLEDCFNACEHCIIQAQRDTAKRVQAVWDKGGYAWWMEALDGIEAYPFDVRESATEDDFYCRGIVFSIEQIK